MLNSQQFKYMKLNASHLIKILFQFLRYNKYKDVYLFNLLNMLSPIKKNTDQHYSLSGK